LAEKPRLLLLGWYRPGTGFTRVLESLLPYLQSAFAVSWYGVGYRGAPFSPLPDVSVMPTNVAGGDLVGAFAAASDWPRVRPDAVLALNDIWYLKHYGQTLGAIRGRVPLVGYFPLDGILEDGATLRPLASFSTLVTYTEAAADNLRDVARRSEFDVPIAVAGHGVDREAFYPTTHGLDEKMALAQRYFGLPSPALVVLNAARPDPRKRVDLTIAGFAPFAEHQTNAYLCLHHAIDHPGAIAALREQAQSLGIGDRVLFWPPTPGPLSDSDLNQLYNACAIGINTSHGEGFGLVSFEHAATGAPQIVPGQPALLALWQAAAIILPALPIQTRISPLTMVAVDPHDVTESLRRLSERAQWQVFSARALQHVQSPAFDWSGVADRLIATLI
jgi:glycosyltransferase involved in cell wall biosynthesis